jgi:hypothetical protein
MRRHWFVLLVTLIAMLPLCAAANESAPSAQDRNSPDQPRPGARQIAGQIDAIIYAQLPKAEMLEKLKPLVVLMDSREEFERKTGLKLINGVTTGPNVTEYQVEGCGLQLVYDWDNNLRVIRRMAKKTADGAFTEMSISQKGFSDDGYVRWYDN